MEAKGETGRPQCVPTGVSLYVSTWEGGCIFYLRLPEQSAVTRGPAFRQQKLIRHQPGGWKAEVRTPTW